MAESLSPAAARRMAENEIEKREAARRAAEKKKQERAENDAKIAAAKKQEKELRSQLKGTDTEQVVGDIAGGVIGEVGFRAIQMAFTKAGLQNALWYTVVPGLLGTVLYAVNYPKRNESMVRASMRGVGAWWAFVGIHDGISIYLGSSAESKAQQAQMVAQLQQLQQQNAALQAQAAQRQQQPGR